MDEEQFKLFSEQEKGKFGKCVNRQAHEVSCDYTNKLYICLQPTLEMLTNTIKCNLVLIQI